MRSTRLADKLPCYYGGLIPKDGLKVLRKWLANWAVSQMLKGTST